MSKLLYKFETDRDVSDPEGTELKLGESQSRHSKVKLWRPT